MISHCAYTNVYFIFFVGLQFYPFAQTAKDLIEDAERFLNQSKKQKAIVKYEEALEVAEMNGDLDLQMKCHLKLASLKDNVINYKEALAHYREFAGIYQRQTEEKHDILKSSVDNLSDSVNDLENSVTSLESEVKSGVKEIEAKALKIDSLTTEQLQSELEIRDLEIVNQRAQLDAKTAENRKNSLILILLLFGVVVVFIARSYFRKRRTTILLRNKNYAIAKEKEKSDDLLLNILPESVANELKEYGKTTPAYHENVTVMFTDFKGFTEFLEAHSPTEIVEMVDFYFSAFDEIVKRHHIEKIKTIGDAYLCVSGIPTENSAHVKNMLNAALEIVDFVDESVRKKKEAGLPFFAIRIGIHAGPLVAGVVGSMKFAYDVWGDTVNIAARKLLTPSGIYETLGHKKSRLISESAINGWEMGFEPTTPGTTTRCSNQLSYNHHLIFLLLLSVAKLPIPI